MTDRTTKLGRRPRHRGIALMLVMLALALVFTIVLTFISQQSVSIAIARNITSSSKARQICETGMALAIFEVQTNPDWRTDHAQGKWVDASQFVGGTFTITAEDGEDLNGDGVISGLEGDGDLADDPYDRMTLTAVGTFQGVSHRVQALVIPEEAPTDVPKIILDGYMRLKDAAILDSFDSSLGPYGAGNSGSEATIATNTTLADQLDLSGSALIKGDVLVGPGADPNDVINFNGGTITGSTGVLSEPITIPTFSEPTGLPPSVGDVTYGSGTSVLSSDLHATKMKIENGGVLNILGHVTILTEEDFNITHASKLNVLAGSSLKLFSKKALNFYGTSKTNVPSADPGALEIYNLGTTTIKIDDSAQVYALVFSPDAQMNVTGSSHFYGRFTGKSLDITGTSGVHLDLAGGPPPPPSGPVETVVFSNDPIKISGDAYIDSYDSKLGPYGGGNVHQNARVITNATGAGDVDVDGGSIGGDVEVGVGGNPFSVISNPANVTGDKSARVDPFPLPTVTPPTDLGPTIGNVEFKDDPFLITTDLHVDDLRMATNALVTFSGNIRVLVDGNFTLETGAGFVVAPDSTVEFWIRGKFQVKTGGLSTDPRRVRINLVGNDVAKVETKAQIYGHLIAPERYVLIKTESQVYGSVQARQLEVQTKAAIHQDETNVWDEGEEAEGGGEGPEVVAGGGNRPYRIRWIENP